MVQVRGWRRWMVHLLAGTMAGLGLATLAAPASATDTGLLNPCSYRSGFGGSYYCRVNIEDVTSTRYGTGKRVYLSATVFDLPPNSDLVTVRQVRWTNPCPPGKICGATINVYYVDLTVRWPSTYRPPLGYLIKLYGTTTTGSLNVAGYVKGGYCGPSWELCF